MPSRLKHHAGDTIGRYTLVRSLAPGFPGPLWMVESDANSGRIPAIARVFTFSDRVSHATREILGSAAWDAMEVDHPNVCKAVDVVFEERHVTTVYDYVESQQLNVVERIGGARKTPLSPGVAIRVVVDVLDAVEAVGQCARRLGAPGAHGGLLPDSCLVATSGRTHVLDAFVAGCAALQPELLRVKHRVGYAAPEQFLGSAADVRSDVYAVGCLLWELLANRRLHLGGIASVERNVTGGQLLSLRSFATGEGEPFERLVSAVTRATSVDPAKRFESLGAMREAVLATGIEPAPHAAVGGFLEVLAGNEIRQQRDAVERSTIALLSEVIATTAMGYSSERPERRSSVPPSSLDEPIPSSIDSHVKFEVPPPFLPPEAPPTDVEETLPLDPRVPSVSLDDVALSAPPPSSARPSSAARSDPDSTSLELGSTGEGPQTDDAPARGDEGAAALHTDRAESPSGDGSDVTASVDSRSATRPAIPRASKTGAASSRERFRFKPAIGASGKQQGGDEGTLVQREGGPDEGRDPSPRVRRPDSKPEVAGSPAARVTSPGSPRIEERESDVGDAIARDRQDTKAGLGSLRPGPTDEDGGRNTVPGSPAPQANKEGVGLLLTKSVDGSHVPAGKLEELLEAAESIPAPPLDDDTPRNEAVPRGAAPARASRDGAPIPPITWFFATTTLALSVVVVVLLSRSPAAPAEPVRAAPGANTSGTSNPATESVEAPTVPAHAESSAAATASSAVGDVTVPHAAGAPSDVGETKPATPDPAPVTPARAPKVPSRVHSRPGASKPKFVPEEL